MDFGKPVPKNIPKISSTLYLPVLLALTQAEDNPLTCRRVTIWEWYICSLAVSYLTESYLTQSNLPAMNGEQRHKARLLLAPALMVIMPNRE